MKSLKESLFDSELITKEPILFKLVRALTKIYNNNLTVGYEEDPSGQIYVINPESLGVASGNGYSAKQLIAYCSKIKELSVESGDGDPSTGWRPYTKIGDDTCWIKIVWGSKYYKILRTPLMHIIEVSKEFYNNCPFKKDQSHLKQRNINRYQGKAW